MKENTRQTLGRCGNWKSRIQTHFSEAKALYMSYQGVAPRMSFASGPSSSQAFFLSPTSFIGSRAIRPNDGGWDWNVCTCMVLLVNSFVEISSFPPISAGLALNL